MEDGGGGTGRNANKEEMGVDGPHFMKTCE